jgi:hypothetical protein
VRNALVTSVELEEANNFALPKPPKRPYPWHDEGVGVRVEITRSKILLVAGEYSQWGVVEILYRRVFLVLTEKTDVFERRRVLPRTRSPCQPP